MMWLHSLFLSTSGEPSLLEELWAYLEGKYFSVETGGYEHIMEKYPLIEERSRRKTSDEE